MSLPPLKGLLALEAVVRHGSVSRAAVELGVSQPAVSQQLRSLERFFGRPMIERSPTGFTLDPEVELFAARLRPAVAEIRAAAAAFDSRSREAAQRLTVALLATFAQRWLIPRLADFQQRHPEIDLRLMTTSLPADLERPDVDLSIRCGRRARPDLRSELLLANRLFPVASPAVLAACPLHRVTDLRDAVLIRVEAPPRDQDWPRWLAAAGAGGLAPKSWQTYANSSHALEAATAGLGVAMAHTPFVADSLASGRLVAPFDRELPDAEGDYFLVSPKREDVPRRIALFRRWLLDQRAAQA